MLKIRKCLTCGSNIASVEAVTKMKEVVCYVCMTDPNKKEQIANLKEEDYVTKE